MTYTNVFTDKYNAVTGAVVAVLTAIFGTYWYDISLRKHQKIQRKFVL